jgi:hypothetical protein
VLVEKDYNPGTTQESTMKSLHLLAIYTLLVIQPVIGIAQAQSDDSQFAREIDKTRVLPDVSTVRVDYRFGNVMQPMMHAVKIKNPSEIQLDGIVTESAWLSAPVATEFTQRFPEDNAKSTQKTEVRILYGEDAIYVGFIAYDTAPDSILAPLFRRDGTQSSDWVYVSFDSYNDRRTAFSFAVNPRGVQKDILYYNDNQEDELWDVVWEAKSYVGEFGWSAEVKIPFSQLRFSNKSEILEWGVNFQRRIARNGEISFWAPSPRTEESLVSKFGRLHGIKDLDEPRRLEISPYAAGSLLRAPNPGNSNPFYSNNSYSGNVGGDIKYGVTSDFTLTATINPDFGQVEADPAVINLTANENFFNERRPFFLEGSDIFLFGRTQTYSTNGNPITFYSRRIGRTPQGSAGLAGVDAIHVDRPDYTTIATAAKLSGKTKSGWSVGLLNAYTLTESADFQTLDGSQNSFKIEPASNYLVARTKKDFNNGNTYVGGFLSAVNRSVSDTYFENFLRSSAYLGGIDYEHNFMNRNWVASGTMSFTSINGSPDAIRLAQRSPVRFYQRIDSENLEVDGSKTRLGGLASEFSIQKRGGNDHWLGSLTFSSVTPGYEANDLGFQNRADYKAINGGVVYRENTPKYLQHFEAWLFRGQSWNYDNDNIGHWYNLGTDLRMRNQWRINSEFMYRPSVLSDRLTRGGPLAKMPDNFSFNANINTNPSKMFSYNFGTFARKDTEDGGFYEFFAGVRVRPATWLQFSINPAYFKDNNKYQYLTTVSDGSSNTFGNRYVFAEIEQQTVSTSIRLDWTFSPKVSLQTYLRPYITSGTYSNFKELAQARTHNYTVYGSDAGTIEQINGQYYVDPDGAGPSSPYNFGNPDFNYRSIQGNAVFRWEYMPGSALFLVWQQQREQFMNDGAFDMRGSMSDLFKAKATNVFLIKVSYWLGS